MAISGPDNGPLVILIHGSLDRASGMARLGRVCSQHRQVARYDRRGYSERWEHPGPLNVDGNVDDIASFIGEKSAILIGHSYGGQIALAAASRLGHQIVGVSTYETPLSWMPWWPSNTAGAAGVQAGPNGADSPVPGVSEDREEAGKAVLERKSRGAQPQDRAVLRAATQEFQQRHLGQYKGWWWISQ